MPRPGNDAHGSSVARTGAGGPLAAVHGTVAGIQTKDPSTCPDTADPNALILALAARQHGVVARWQLKELGISPPWIEYRLKNGRFESIHPGIYRVGPIAAPFHRELAALLACGSGAVLSHHSAGALWGLLPKGAVVAPVSVSITRDTRRGGGEIHVHRVKVLAADEITYLDGLPLTTSARTLLDLAGSLSVRELEQTIARADRNGLLDRKQIEVLTARYPRRRGNARVRALLTNLDGLAFTRSEAEERFLALVRKAGLRIPETNVTIHGFEVDTLWRAERLVVEIDGLAFHSAKDAFERDRHRDGVLTAAGLRVMRITWRQLTQTPEALLVRLAQALAVRVTP